MNPKILSVDDNPANLVSVRRLLSKIQGLDIIEARNGNEALAATLDHEFALILLDVHMPDMDGFEVATFLAQEQRTRDTPLIFVTATYADDLHRMKGYRFGAVDYITKPLDERILLSKVQVFLELHRNRAELQEAREQLQASARQIERETLERKRTEFEIMHLATHDPLTGLANRRLFMERGDAAVQRATRDGRALGVIILDVDGFRHINEQHGHPNADRALVVLSKRLTSALGTDMFSARIDGNEFAVIVDDHDDEQLTELANRLADNLSEPIDIGGRSSVPDGRISLRLSVGTSRFPADGDCFMQLILTADKHARAAKQGR